MQLFGTTGQKFPPCPGTKGQRDELKILPRDRTGRDSQNSGRDGPGQPKSGMGRGTKRDRAEKEVLKQEKDVLKQKKYVPKQDDEEKSEKNSFSFISVPRSRPGMGRDRLSKSRRVADFELVLLSLCPGTRNEFLSLCPKNLHCPVPLETLVLIIPKDFFSEVGGENPLRAQNKK